MNGDRANFDSWYVDVLEKLFPNREAGFAILMISFPLLERLLRNRANLLPSDGLNDSFYKELLRIFPAFSDIRASRTFWQIYRNGLLHQVSPSTQNRKRLSLPIGWLTIDKPGVSVDSDGGIWVNPVDFAKRVLSEIQLDFETFSKIPFQAPLPNKYKLFAESKNNNGEHSPYLGTRAKD